MQRIRPLRRSDGPGHGRGRVVRRAAFKCPHHLRSSGIGLACARLGFATFAMLAATMGALAETLPEALVKAYQNNSQFNAERARQRGTDENVPQALAGYRPQIVASLSAELQAVSNLLPDNTLQRAA